MIRARDVFTQIQKLTSKLIELGLAIDQCFPSIRELDNSQNLEVNISGIQSDITSIFLKKIPYRIMYHKLLESRVYNIKKIDGAINKMQYIFCFYIIVRDRL